MNVSVVSRKGGTGKTVTALHLAGYLAELSGPRKVLLVDTDPSRNAFGWAQRAAKRGEQPFVVVTEDEYEEALELVNPDHVVIDVPGSPTRQEVQSRALQSEVVVMPAMPGGMELDTVLQTIEDVRGVGAVDRCRVLLTVVPPWPYRRGPEARAGLERLAPSTGLQLFSAEVRRYEAFVLATDEGRLVRDVANRKAGRAWADYVAVGEELVGWVRELRTRDLGANAATNTGAGGGAGGGRVDEG